MFEIFIDINKVVDGHQLHGATGCTHPSAEVGVARAVDAARLDLVAVVDVRVRAVLVGHGLAVDVGGPGVDPFQETHPAVDAGEQGINWKGKKKSSKR